MRPKMGGVRAEEGPDLGVSTVFMFVSVTVSEI